MKRLLLAIVLALATAIVAISLAAAGLMEDGKANATAAQYCTGAVLLLLYMLCIGALLRLVKTR